MRLVPSRRMCVTLVAGVVALVLPVAAGAARTSPGHPTAVRAGARPAVTSSTRAHAKRTAKVVERAAGKSHHR